MELSDYPLKPAAKSNHSPEILESFPLMLKTVTKAMQ